MKPKYKQGQTIKIKKVIYCGGTNDTFATATVQQYGIKTGTKLQIIRPIGIICTACRNNL